MERDEDDDDDEEYAGEDAVDDDLNKTG